MVNKDGLIEAFGSHDPAEPATATASPIRASVVVNGDTVKAQNMVRFSKDADVLMHEALHGRMLG